MNSDSSADIVAEEAVTVDMIDVSVRFALRKSRGRGGGVGIEPGG